MRRALALVVALGLAGAGCAHLPGHDHGAASEQDAASDPDHGEHADHVEQGDAPDDGPAAGATPHVSDTDFDALFSVDCGFSHRASDDPIVFPGQPGASHSHDFFGSEATDASSTGASLLGTPTTCEDPEDTASYWVPTLSVDGTPVTPSLLRAYYRARPGVDVRDVTAPPLGLAMIAGDPARGGDHDHGDGGAHDHGSAGVSGGGAATTTTEAAHDHATADHATDDHAHHGDPSATTTTVVPAEDDPTAEAGWGCGFRPRTLQVTPPTDCTDASPLTLRLRFPDCWNGEDLDSPDHRSHVARSVDGECPEGYPVLMSELQVSVVWPVTGEEAAGVTLSSGGVAGAHGDFLNGWDPEALDRHVALCIHAEANCTIG